MAAPSKNRVKADGLPPLVAPERYDERSDLVVYALVALTLAIGSLFGLVILAHQAALS
ncbi:hypothetical protein [Hansschlegelia zhihuaiae]|uniref:hypothetical protein n=1 Tax=Hansschlegelia zhihuaiae TaxID=405005 RepID=UPI0013E8C3AF|nr:hypothetical protein [Hansschlegelia zhihuaiae]